MAVDSHSSVVALTVSITCFFDTGDSAEEPRLVAVFELYTFFSRSSTRPWFPGRGYSLQVPMSVEYNADVSVT